MDTKRKEQLQRTLVFLGLGLLFTLSIWFIFRPSANEQSAAEQGLNKDVPQASPDELPTSKLKAYELGRDEEAEGRKNQLLGTLADYFNREGEAKAEPEPSEEVPAAIGRSIARRPSGKATSSVSVSRNRPSFGALRNAGSKKDPRFGPCATQEAKRTLVLGPAQRRKQ